MNVTVIAEALSSEKLCGTEMPVVPAQGHMDTETKLLMVQVSRARQWAYTILSPGAKLHPKQSPPERSRASPHPSARLDGACGCCNMQGEHQHPAQGERLCPCLGTITGMVPSLPFWGEIGRFEATGCVMFSLLPSSHRPMGLLQAQPDLARVTLSSPGPSEPMGCW